MDKNTIINDLARQGEISKICMKVACGADIWQDLYQEVLLNLLSYSEERIIEMHTKKYLKFFTIRMITNMYKSKNSRFYKEIKKFTEHLNNELEDVPEEFEEAVIDLNERLEAKPFYSREIYKLYMNEGSVSKVHRMTKIPYNSVYKTCRDLEKEIRNDLKTYNVLFEAPENSEASGIHYYRQLVPAYYMQNHNKEFQYTKTNSVEGLQYDQLSDFQMVQFSRHVSTDTLQMCKNAGVKTVLDIDDYWQLPNKHILSDEYKKHNVTATTIEALKAVDYVTTTTEHMADIISQFNKNVTVLPNAIDPDQPQYEIKPIESDRLRFGWMGGIHHIEDIKALEASFKRLAKDPLRNEIQLCLGGFNVMDTTHGIYQYYENLFTSNYSLVNGYGGYKEYLKCFSEESNEVGDRMPYKRIWAKNTFSYIAGYNEFDVALAPLQKNLFNSCKSQLKVIEAGFMKKALIASNVMPYTIDCNEKNSILVNGGVEWFTAMKWLAKDRAFVEDLAERLHEAVKDKYHIKTVNKTRVELYKRIME